MLTLYYKNNFVERWVLGYHVESVPSVKGH
jgi:hypothetical protein